MRQVIAVASGKGGVGKTLLTGALGIALSRMGKRTLVADADMGMRNLDLPLGVFLPGRYTLWDAACRRCSGKEAVAPAAENLDVLPGTPRKEWKDIPKGLAEKAFRAVSEDYDCVLIDCPAGLGKGVRWAADLADGVLLVTDGTPSSLRAVQRMETALAGLGEIWHLLNRAPQKEGDEARRLFWSEPGRIGTAVGIIPLDEEAADLSAAGRLIEYDDAGAFGKSVHMAARALFDGMIYPEAVWEALRQQSGSAEAAPSAGYAVSRLLKGRRTGRWKWKGR